MNVGLKLKQIFNKKAYSLLEVVVSLAIIAVMMVMLTNILIISLSVAAKTAARSNVREETSNILSNMKRDIRNAEVINSCSGENDQAICEGVLVISGKFTWKLCDNEDGTKGVCKFDAGGNIIEKSPEYLTIDKLLFDVGFDKTLDKRTILVTIVSSYKGGDLNIKNIVQQTSISTRNYKKGGASTSLAPLPYQILSYSPEFVSLYNYNSHLCLHADLLCETFYH